MRRHFAFAAAAAAVSPSGLVFLDAGAMTGRHRGGHPAGTRRRPARSKRSSASAAIASGPASANATSTAAGRRPCATTCATPAAAIATSTIERASGELFDHFVGLGENCRRHLKVKCLRRFSIDYKFEPTRALDRQIGRLGPFQNTINEEGSSTRKVRNSCGVSQQSPGFGLLPV